MSLRSEWQGTKAKTEKAIPKGFFGTENLGPLLDKVDEAERKIDKLKEKMGTYKTKEEQDKAKDEMTRAKRELDQALQKAGSAAEVYRLAAEDFKKRPGMTQAGKDALTTVHNFLYSQIVTPIGKRRQELKK